MGMTPDVSVVIVSYNTRSLLRECLSSVLRSRGATVEVFVVDNRSTDGSTDMVEREFPSVSLICNPRNVGFAAANNLAIARARGRYVLLLNPDATVGADTIGQLAGYLDRHDDAGVCGPLVRFPDGTFQSCGYDFPTLRAELRESKRIGRIIGWFSADTSDTSERTAPEHVGWVDGCCLMARLKAIRDVGGLDEQYFMYGEELDLCRMIQANGWRVVAMPTTAVMHHRGKSTESASGQAMRWLTESRLRYYRKHYGLATALAVSMWFTAGYLKQARAAPAASRAKLGGVMDWWSAAVLRRVARKHGR
jgi:N-acetylglucosaminyl-diphospho-decaprenol L-rhamnosyltransferase